MDGYDWNAHPTTFTEVSEGHFKGSWKSTAFTGFGSVSVAGDHTCVYHDADTETRDATCETAASTVKTCACCGHKDVQTTGTALGHEFGEYIYDNNATCLADGTKTRTCSRCDAANGTVKAEGTALGHDFNNYVYDDGTAMGHDFGECVSDDNATCTADATETAKCSRCDATDVRTLEGTRLEHVSDNGTVTREATLLAPGEIEYRCTRCHTLLRTEAIPQLQSGVPKTGDSRTAGMIFTLLAVLGAAGTAGVVAHRKRANEK